MMNNIIEKRWTFRRKLFGVLLFAAVLLCTGCEKSEEKVFFSSLDQTEQETSIAELEKFEEQSEQREDPADGESDGTSGSENNEMPENVQPAVSADIYVDVCGAVRNPGVYCLSASSRVFEAIELAGGYTEEAAASYINRAGVLSDGQQIYIPTQEEVEQQTFPVENENDSERSGNANTETQDSQNSGKVNINSATKEELTTLSGIGESKAQAIIAYREEHGSFSSVEAITNVPGIKDGTYDKIKDGITVE